MFLNLSIILKFLMKKKTNYRKIAGTSKENQNQTFADFIQ